MPIYEELARVMKVAELSGAEFFDNSHKRDREWWILGHATDLLNRAGLTHPTHAQATEPPEPDFITFSADGTLFKHIEIVEVLRHGRRRHEEMKRAFSSDSTTPKTIYPVADPFRSFREILLSKFEKRYGSDCWLVLMHSMTISEFPRDWKRGWAGLLRDEIDRWQCDGSFVGLTESPYEHILVLNSRGDELVSIYPDWSIIHHSRPKA